MFPHARRKRLLAVTAIATAVALTAACGGGDADDPADDPSDDPGTEGAIAGDLTIMTWRTDLLEDGTLDGYAERFMAEYPDVTIEFQGFTDYEGEITTLMSTDDYGDVLAIPGPPLTPATLGEYFEPLGTIEEIEETYRFVRDKSYDGMAYGIPVVGNAQGFVYNKEVWEAAGVTDLPTTPEEFLEDLQMIKDSTEAVPLYTNYAADWTITQWEGHRGSISADPEYVKNLIETDAPWAEGTDHNVIDTLLWDVVEQGLIEEDPTTTDWESSKGMLARGEIATMVLGSWSIVQMQDAAEAEGLDRGVIGYMPFPAQVDGAFHSTVGPDYMLGISVHSDAKEAAWAWIEWFNAESGFSDSQQGISPLKDGGFPDALADFEAAGVELVEQLPADPGNEGLVEAIDSEGEIGLWTSTYRKRIIDAARGQSGETLQEIFDDLNSRWADARATVIDG